MSPINADNSFSHYVFAFISSHLTRAEKLKQMTVNAKIGDFKNGKVESAIGFFLVSPDFFVVVVVVVCES